MQSPMACEKAKLTGNPRPKPRSVRNRAMTVLNNAVKARDVITLFMSKRNSMKSFHYPDQDGKIKPFCSGKVFYDMLKRQFP